MDYKIGVGGVLVIFVLVIGLAIGSILNIVKLTQCDFEEPYRAEIIRTIGIFSFGSIIGYMDIGK